MKAINLLFLVCTVLYLSCTNNNPKRDSLNEFNSSIEESFKFVINNSQRNVNVCYLNFMNDTARQKHEKIYANYQKLFDLTNSCFSYITKTKTTIIDKGSFSYIETNNDLNLKKEKVISCALDNTDLPHYDSFLKFVKELKIYQKVELDQNDSEMYQIMYLSKLQSDFAQLLSAYGSFNICLK